MHNGNIFQFQTHIIPLLLQFYNIIIHSNSGVFEFFASGIAVFGDLFDALVAEVMQEINQFIGEGARRGMRSKFYGLHIGLQLPILIQRQIDDIFHKLRVNREDFGFFTRFGHVFYKKYHIKEMALGDAGDVFINRTDIGAGGFQLIYRQQVDMQIIGPNIQAQVKSQLVGFFRRVIVNLDIADGGAAKTLLLMRRHQGLGNVLGDVIANPRAGAQGSDAERERKFDVRAKDIQIFFNVGIIFGTIEHFTTSDYNILRMPLL